MNEIPFTSAANVTRAPELRSTSSGQAVASVGIAINHRRLDPATRQWVDGTTTFLVATVWGDQAKHVADSISVGDRVVIIGRLVTRTWTPESGPHAGEEQRRLEVVAAEIGPSLRWATATVTKVQREDAPGAEEPPF
jgi:single-strand DNA-binding protein